ncbi:hypothetical protein [Helicobacter trogontum]|uniref:DUF4411 family protein n=1 Tax=Helicobacter trogontum TaxID=50960 RepID=A0A4V6I1X8_9HELI|nr:hypothetical protein [Helicobacter trogontum]MDY5186054.1 hypothetical protein [Helicobacter trogontum]TLD94062.1 hypothetical protein LS80_010440 [Helicobacter trogontum]
MNRFLFDTNSLLNFVKYYLPFDENSELRQFLLQGFVKDRFLLLNEVKTECKRISSSLVARNLQNKYNL